MAEIRVEISKKVNRSMVAFRRDPETRRVIILLRLRPAMPVEELVHEAIHIVQVAKALETGKALTFDLAANLEKELVGWTCNGYPEILRAYRPIAI